MRNWAPVIVAALLLVLLLVPLYVLSIVPAARLSSDVISYESWNTIYAPVIWLSDHWKPFNDWLTGYHRWWYGETEQRSHVIPVIDDGLPKAPPE